MKAIVCKYRPSTRTKPARIKASDSDGNTATVSYHGDGDDGTEFDPWFRAVRKLCHKMGWTGRLVRGSLRPGVEVFVWTGTVYEVKKPVT